jgi:hypothetical protein
VVGRDAGGRDGKAGPSLASGGWELAVANHRWLALSSSWSEDATESRTVPARISTDWYWIMLSAA